jgi:hypothetical protein
MDLYQILRVSTDASEQEIEKAYARLLKEARYNTQINRKDVEMAFRVLGNPQQKKAYDAKLSQQTKVDSLYDAVKEKKKKARKLLSLQKMSASVGGMQWITDKAKKLILTALVLFLVAAIYFLVRFGYYLKEFSPGDVLYLRSNHARFGIVLKEEQGHYFPDGKVKQDAYLVKIGDGEEWWVPQNIVKVSCYKLK